PATRAGCASRLDHRVRLIATLEAHQSGREPRVAARVFRRHFDQALELNQRVLEISGVVQESSQIRSRRNETRIDVQRLAVRARGQIRSLTSLGEYSETVVGLGQVRVDAARTLQQLLRALEVAALQLDQALVGQRVHESRAVFEREREAGV